MGRDAVGAGQGAAPARMLVMGIALAAALGCGALARADDAMVTSGPSCSDFPAKVYDADGDYFYDAELRECPPNLFDLTHGDRAAQPGQEMVFSEGHGEKRRPWAIVRAYPNRAYAFTGWKDERAGTTVTTADAPAWDETLTALPFVPRSFVRAKDSDLYHYQDLVLLDRSAAYPLNEQSVLVGVDGYLFVSPQGLLKVLALAPHSQYREVWYYQRDDAAGTLKRAYIPRILRRDMASAWSLAQPDWASGGSVSAAAPVAKSEVADDTGRKVVALIAGAIALRILYGLGAFDDQGNIACTEPGECK